MKKTQKINTGLYTCAELGIYEQPTVLSEKTENNIYELYEESIL